MPHRLSFRTDAASALQRAKIRANGLSNAVLAALLPGERVDGFFRLGARGIATLTDRSLIVAKNRARPRAVRLQSLAVIRGPYGRLKKVDVASDSGAVTLRTLDEQALAVLLQTIPPLHPRPAHGDHGSGVPPQLADVGRHRWVAAAVFFLYGAALPGLFFAAPWLAALSMVIAVLIAAFLMIAGLVLWARHRAVRRTEARGLPVAPQPTTGERSGRRLMTIGVAALPIAALGVALGTAIYS